MKYFFSTLFKTIIVLSVIISCTGEKEVQSQSSKADIHSPAQLLKIMEESKLVYNLDLLKEKITFDPDSQQILHNQYYLITKEDGFVLLTYELNIEEKSILNQAEEKFQNKELDQSLNLFKKLYTVKPTYAYALTMVGDVYYNLSQFDSAEVYFLKAISQNPVDYTAHWFLADTYWEMGRFNDALDYITVAHLLNKNNPRLLSRMKSYREQSGDNWDDWFFVPQYQISKEGNKINVKSESEWLGYAIAKAIWKYEPGYAKSMIGNEPNEYAFNPTEEAEAMSSLLAGGSKWEHIQKIVDDGFFKEFYHYEIVARELPITLLLLPQDDFQRIAEYVKMYH